MARQPKLIYNQNAKDARSSRGMVEIKLTVPAVCRDEFIALAKLRREMYSDLDKYNTRYKFKRFVEQVGWTPDITGQINTKGAPLTVKVKRGDLTRTIYNEASKFFKPDDTLTWPEIAGRFIAEVADL